MQPLDIAPVWARFNESLIRLVDYVPDDKINWSPKPELWNFRGILLHIAGAREGWLHGTVKMPFERLFVYEKLRSKEDIKAAYAQTWKWIEEFVSDPVALDRVYDDDEGDVSGHWIAFHLLEHDIHHRADVMHYLALLGIETPDVGTP
jgi:uncharacterized damage-inducible protein DinB